MSTHVQPHRFTELQVLGLGSVVQSAKKAPPSAGCFFVPGQFQERNYARINRVRLGCKFQVGVDGDGGWGLNRSHFNLKTVGI